VDWPAGILIALAASSVGLAAGIRVGWRHCLAGLAVLARHGVPVDLKGRRYRVVQEEEYHAMRDALRRQGG
jgi:hypothetical protein